MSIVYREKLISSTFSPTSITGCSLWLDGTDPAGTGTAPSVGATVSTWVDKSTSAKNATAGGTPTYVSGGGINFNGSSWFSNTSFVQNLSQRSIFIVMQETTRTHVGGVFPLIPTPSSGYDYDSTGLSVETANGLRFYNGAGYQSDIGNTSLLVKAVYNDNMNVRAGTGFVNGNAATTVTASYTGGTSSGYGIGARWLGGSISLTYPLSGVIFEIMYFNTPLDITNRRKIEAYLAQKWGVTASLPVGHPGLTQTFYGGLITVKSTVSIDLTMISYNPLSSRESRCILWLDASDPRTLYTDSAGTTLASVNGTVGYWRDKSSSGFHCTQATVGYRPTYVSNARNGRSILSFNGLSNFLNMPQFTAVPLTIFFVAQGTVFIPNTFFLSLGATGNTVMMRMLSSQAVYGVDGITAITTTNADTNWHLWTLTISSTTATFYFDGTLVGTSSWTYGSAYTFATNTIASWNQQVNSKATTLNIPEIIFYNTVLATSEQQQVESYLASKWSIVRQINTTVPTIVAIPKISFASSGLVITHQDGRPWKLTGTAVALNAGTQMSLTIYAGGDVFNSANGRVGLFNNGSSSAAIRHSGYVMYANTFGANNYDFGWYFVSSGSKYLIYNDYPSIGSAWQVSYDPAQDRVLIVQPGDAKYGMLWNITPRLTLSYVYTSYPT